QNTTNDGADAGTCHHIAINNSRYNHVNHHPYWAGGDASGEFAMCSLGVKELATALCSLLQNTLTVQFITAHSHLGNVSIYMEGPGGPYTGFTKAPPAPQTSGEQWYGTATLSNFATLPKCAYVLWLEVQVLLTTGDGTPDDVRDHIGFCKGDAAAARR